MNNFLQDLLLLKTANIEQVFQIVKSISFPLLSICFVLGAVYENLGDQNFLGLFKRIIFALFLISFGSSFLKSTVDLSFDISARILTSVQNTNPVVQLIDRARKISQGKKQVDKSTGFIDKSKNAAKGLWESQAFVSKILLDDGISSLVFIFSYAALMLLGQLFTIVYNFTYVSIPLLAALIVFPPTYSVANSISRTIAWVFLMPICTMITILLLSSSFSFPQDGTNVFYFTSLENLINFCIMALMLLFVPTIVSGFLSGSGVLTAAETFTKATTTAALTGGKSLALNGARSLGGKIVFGKNFGIATMAKQGMTKGLDKLGNRSITARNNLNQMNSQDKSSTHSMSTSSGINSSEHVSGASTGQGMASNSTQPHEASKAQSSFISRTLDKSIVANDSVLNFKKNHIATSAVKTSSRKDPSGLSTESKAKLFNKYKQSAHKEFHKMRPVDYQVSKIRGENVKRPNPEWMDHKKIKYKGKRV